MGFKIDDIIKNELQYCVLYYNDEYILVDWNDISPEDQKIIQEENFLRGLGCESSRSKEEINELIERFIKLSKRKL